MKRGSSLLLSALVACTSAACMTPPGQEEAAERKAKEAAEVEAAKNAEALRQVKAQRAAAKASAKPQAPFDPRKRGQEIAGKGNYKKKPSYDFSGAASRFPEAYSRIMAATDALEVREPPPEQPVGYAIDLCKDGRVQMAWRKQKSGNTQTDSAVLVAAKKLNFAPLPEAMQAEFEADCVRLDHLFLWPKS